MREILFQGRSKDSGKWVEGYYFKTLAEKNYITKYNMSFEVIPETVSQCVGIVDKNDNSIFEGHIVYWDSSQSYRKKGKYEIVFQPKKCGFGLKMIEHPYEVYGMQAGKQLEVIGNIHDNPELLESE